jgi:fatty acid desaturase
VFFLLGLLIKYKKAAWLISGYNTASKAKKQQYDIDKLCRYTGNLIFVLSGVLAITGVFTLIFSNSVVTVAMVGMIVFAAAAVCGVIFLNTGNRVKKNGSAKV